MRLNDIQNNIILYRAMSPEEAEATLREGKPVFKKRWKWFSNNKTWVEEYIHKNGFANSQFKTDPYSVILKFVFDSDEHFRQLNKKEWMLDVRKMPLIKTISVSSVLSENKLDNSRKKFNDTLRQVFNPDPLTIKDKLKKKTGPKFP